jgi:pyruvate dehydrogenase E1 component alpha subunit
VCDGPQTQQATTSKEEMIKVFDTMHRIRRMEISCDNEYKARNIRGFCHLSDGQEAVATGLAEALDKRDNIIGTYRTHGIHVVRGDKVSRVVGELFGRAGGASGGKGGSMHFYSKENRFWGGAGIVGAQVPVGAGLAFADRYQTVQSGKPDGPFPITIAMYGDGAANQGQIWEAANMSKLWKLPIIYFCENNHYGMGTSVARHSSNTQYYTQGGRVIPGIRIDGMDYLAVREGMKWAKEFVSKGQPLFVEVVTYRYHGHSMSDPGITYRGKDEVKTMRETKDCIKLTQRRILEAGWASESELKERERAIKDEVAQEVEIARAMPIPPPEELYTDVYFNQIPEFVRGIDRLS